MQFWLGIPYSPIKPSLLCYVSQGDDTSEKDTSSQKDLDLGFPDEDDEQSQDGQCTYSKYQLDVFFPHNMTGYILTVK